MSKAVGITALCTTCGVVVALILAAAVSGRAQDERRYTLNAGGGFSPLLGHISDRLDNGWNVTVGGGYDFTRHFEANLQFTYNGFGVRPLVLAEAGAPATNSHMWSITVDPKLRLHPSGRVDPYVVGGVGYYRRTIQFTQPTVAPVFLFDPFFDTFFSELVQANIVLGNITRGSIGGNLGAGFDVPFFGGTRFSIEARYQYAGTGLIPMRMIPLTAGIKW